MLFENVDASKEPRITVVQQGTNNKPAIWFHQASNGLTAVLVLSEQIQDNLRIYIPNGVQHYTTDSDGVKSITLVTEESFNHWWAEVKNWLDSNLETTIVNWIEKHWDDQFQPHVNKTITAYDLKLMNDHDNSLNNTSISYRHDATQPRGVIPKIHDMIKEEIQIRESTDTTLNNKIDDLLPVGYIIPVFKTNNRTRAQLQKNYLRCDGSQIPSSTQYDELRNLVGTRIVTPYTDPMRFYQPVEDGFVVFIDNMSIREWLSISDAGNTITLDGTETISFISRYWSDTTYDIGSFTNPGGSFPGGYSNTTSSSRVAASGHAWCKSSGTDLKSAGQYYVGLRTNHDLFGTIGVDTPMFLGAEKASNMTYTTVAWTRGTYSSGGHNSSSVNICKGNISSTSICSCVSMGSSKYIVGKINGGPSNGSYILIGVFISPTTSNYLPDTSGIINSSSCYYGCQLPDLTRDGTYLGGGSSVGVFREGSVPTATGSLSYFLYTDNQPLFPFSGSFFSRTYTNNWWHRGTDAPSGSLGSFTTYMDLSYSNKVYKDNVTQVTVDYYPVEYWIKFKSS